jgi:hypothetical protein
LSSEDETDYALSLIKQAYNLTLWFAHVTSLILAAQKELASQHKSRACYWQKIANIFYYD